MTREDMDGLYPEFALYVSKAMFARTDTVIFLPSEVSTRVVTLLQLWLIV